jgi:hypothetical protein
LGLVKSISPDQDSHIVSRTITINCDRRDSFGLYKMGVAAAVMPLKGFLDEEWIPLPHIQASRSALRHGVADGKRRARHLRCRAGVGMSGRSGRSVKARSDRSRGRTSPVESVCVHLDTPGAVAVAREVHRAIEAYLS